MADVDDVETVERWQIRTPRSGKQGEFRGEECFVFDLSLLAGDELERSLRLVNPSRRRGRPIIYRADRQLLGDAFDDDEERVIAAASTRAQDPEEAAQILAIKELRQLRATLVADCDARRREVERLEGAVARLRDERDREFDRIRRQVEAQQEHGQKLIRETQEHHDAELRRTRSNRSELEKQTTEDLRQVSAQVELLTGAKREINKLLRPATAKDVLDSLGEHVSAALDSPLAQAAAAQLHAMVAAKVTHRTGQAVDADDVLAAFVLKGRAAAQRRQALDELRTEAVIDPRRLELVIAGADLFAGRLDLKTVVGLVKHTTDSLRIV